MADPKNTEPNADENAGAVRVANVRRKRAKAFNASSDAKGKVTVRPAYPVDRIEHGDLVIESSGTEVERSQAKELHEQGIALEEV
jgi:hypothetical protein